MGKPRISIKAVTFEFNDDDGNLYDVCFIPFHSNKGLWSISVSHEGKEIKAWSAWVKVSGSTANKFLNDALQTNLNQQK